MKRLLAFLLLATLAYAQGAGTQQYSTTILSNQPYTVATLPSSPPTGFLAIVTDGNGVSCTAGSSTTKVLCRYSGSAWQVVGSSVAGTVTSVSGTANQIGSTGGATPVLSITNPFTFPGNATFQAGSTGAPSAIFNIAGSPGFWAVAAGVPYIIGSFNGVDAIAWNGTDTRINSGGIFCWSSSNVSAAGCDTGLSRDSAAVVDVGNGTAGDKSGTVNAATANITGTSTLGIVTQTPIARSSGVAPYFTINIPADTGQTAATEAIGFKTVTATRTWATTGTVALQRENFFAGPTYASASASQTFTDPFTMYLTPPVQGTNAIFTRNHTLGIVDATSASSSITGGFIVATTLGTTATSVGIGGGNVNAGGNGTFGGTLSVTGHATIEGVTSTGATGSGKFVFDTGPTLSALAFSGSAPAITTSGTTPYLNMNTLVKGAVNTCTFNFTTSQFTLAASPLSMCSPVYTLPNAALTWYYTCSFTWSVTAGTTPTLTFGQTFSQAPSAANEWQSIFTSNAGVSIQASQAVTTNSSMTATGTLTTSATLFQANIGGTFTASATSGTFSPTATLTGTSAVGTLRGGCVIQ